MKKITPSPLYFFLAAVFFACCTSSCQKKASVRALQSTPKIIQKSQLSDAWYPHDPEKLSQELDAYFKLAREQFPVAAEPSSIRALIVPHAGLAFSGLCAATAYQTLENRDSAHKNDGITKVVVLCPSHTIFLKGCAVPKFDAYETPFGQIEVDKQAVECLTTSSVFKGDARAHTAEHAIEIQLPFLQKTIKTFKIVPVIVGHTSDSDIDEIIKGLKKIIDKKTLVIISSDFLHHGQRYEYAIFDQHILDNIRSFDSQAMNAIFAQDYRTFENFSHQTQASICGQNPIKILLGAINTHVIDGVNARLSCYYTSAHMNFARQDNNKIDVHRLLADIPDKEVEDSVSYAGIVFTSQRYDTLKKEDLLTGYEKKELLALARRTIAAAFVPQEKQMPNHLLHPIMSFGLHLPTGVFVTLNTKGGDLRGCVGKIVSGEPLFQTVMQMAYASAFEDARFNQLTKQELLNCLIDISILTPPVKVDSYRDIKLGKHGIILSKHAATGGVISSAVFLPQVPPSYGWSLEETLEQLSLKAGLPHDGWRSDCKFEVFEGYEIKEQND